MFDEVFVYYPKEWNFMFAQFFLSIVEWIEFFLLFSLLMFTHNFYFFWFVYCDRNHFKTKKPCVLKNQTAKKPARKFDFGVGG